MRLLDRLALHTLTTAYDTWAKLNAAASRELCARSVHCEVEIGTALHPDGRAYLLTACDRPTCRWTQTTCLAVVG